MVIYVIPNLITLVSAGHHVVQYEQLRFLMWNGYVPYTCDLEAISI